MSISVSIYLNQTILLPLLFKVDNLTFRMADAGGDIKIDTQQLGNLRAASLVEGGMGGRDLVINVPKIDNFVLLVPNRVNRRSIAKSISTVSY